MESIMKHKILAGRLRFLADVFRVMICMPLGWLLFYLKEIYIVCERGTDARDNGYHMFKYIRENHPGKNVYYIIDRDSADYQKVAQLGRVIRYRSWKHCLYFVAARMKISTHIMGYAPGTPYRFQKIRRYIKIPGKHVFLQHGVIKDDLVGLHADRARMDLFICGAKPEYEFIKSVFGHPEGVVRYTGLARYDNLHGHKTERTILVMPTWRMYLSDLSAEEFMRSEYFTHWDELLQHPQLRDLLRKNDLKLIFYPHYEMQKFVDCFPPANDRIIIANFKEYDVQQLLVSTKLLITDYSSVLFDFAYMKKPSVYYQFDKNTFYSKHYKEGYFNYFEDGFGKVVMNPEELLQEIKRNIELDFMPESHYLSRMDGFFELHDNRNCERIYNAVEALR